MKESAALDRALTEMSKDINYWMDDVIEFNKLMKKTKHISPRQYKEIEEAIVRIKCETDIHVAVGMKMLNRWKDYANMKSERGTKWNR